jgi:hypothetical protein
MRALLARTRHVERGSGSERRVGSHLLRGFEALSLQLND